MKIIRIIRMMGFLFTNIGNKCVLMIRGVKYGSKLRTIGNLFVRGTGRITLGDEVTINSSLASNPIGGATRTILYAKDKGEITIGNRCGISNSALVALSKIEIEDNVLIGGNCKIYDHDFHSLDYQTRMLPGNQGVQGKPIVIKEGAFIGAHSIILKGVTIGREAIVGAGSVVTKNIPDGEIWAGNPARFVRANKEIG